MSGPDVGIFFGRPDRSHLLAEHLRARGLRVTLYNDRGVPGTYVPVPYAFPAALRRLLATRHDVYLTGLSFVPSFSLYLNRVLRGAPYVFNATGVKTAMYRERSKGWRFPALAERWLYPALNARVIAGASAVVCNSRYLQASLAAAYPAHAARLRTIYNGVDFQRLDAGRPAAIDGVPASAPKLLAVMTWNYPAKAAGGRFLVDAMGPVTRRVPDARLVIAARASHRRYAEENEAHLAAAPWRDAVTLLYNRSDVPDLLAGADVFVYATPDGSNDSLPRAVLEAQAAGLPVVATATSGCPEIVEDSVTGLVAPWDPEAFAERVVALLADPETRRRFGRQARARAREVFGWERMADAYARLFRDIVSDRRPARIADGCARATRGSL